MELCHCKGRIREFVTLEKRFIRGVVKGKMGRGGRVISLVLQYSDVSNVFIFCGWTNYLT